MSIKGHINCSPPCLSVPRCVTRGRGSCHVPWSCRSLYAPEGALTPPSPLEGGEAPFRRGAGLTPGWQPSRNQRGSGAARPAGAPLAAAPGPAGPPPPAPRPGGGAAPPRALQRRPRAGREACVPAWRGSGCGTSPPAPPARPERSPARRAELASSCPAMAAPPLPAV